MIDWNIQKARELYNVAQWSNGYFDINARGHLIARPDPASGQPGVDVYELTREFAAHELTLPVLVRFSGICTIG